MQKVSNSTNKPQVRSPEQAIAAILSSEGTGKTSGAWVTPSRDKSTEARNCDQFASIETLKCGFVNTNKHKPEGRSKSNIAVCVCQNRWFCVGAQIE